LNDDSLSSLPVELLFFSVAALLIISAFFSSSETGMMALNRYRLRHLAKRNVASAKRAEDLLNTPDRLIGIILIGNNLVNILAAQLATFIGIYYFGESATGAVITTAVLTITVLIFAEVTPKTLAALYPEKIAFPASLVLRPMLKIGYPVVWAINQVSNGIIKLIGVDPNKTPDQSLNSDELRTVVTEAGSLIPPRHQQMLLNILDLEKMTVEDIMIPRSDVEGIDLEDDLDNIMLQIRRSNYTRLPVYKGDINNILGVLHLRNVSRFYQEETELTKQMITRYMVEPYFIPVSTSLNVQLLQFQRHHRRLAIAVDEYGDVQGIVTLEDLLEEIVGEFTLGMDPENNEIEAINDDQFNIEGGTTIRDINKTLGWDLPTDGPKTLNGLLVEHLDIIPEQSVSCQIGNYRFEVTELEDNRILQVTCWQR